MLCAHTLTLVTRALLRVAAAKFEGHAGAIPSIDRAVTDGVARIRTENSSMYGNLKPDDLYMSGEH